MDQASPAQVCEIAVNLDDVSGEVIGHAVGALLAAGALDVWTTPITMKKQRPGVCLSLLCPPQDRDRFARQLIELTGSFGVRYRGWDRLVLERHHETVETSHGPVRIKLGSLEGQIVTAKPEFEDAVTLAQRHGVSVRSVLDEAQAMTEALRRREAGA